MDARGRLAEEPFGWERRSDGSIVISHGGRTVTTLRGAAADRFAARVVGLDPTAAQHLMARATGNFKRGNERR
jgi:hypothetical protein